MTIRLAAALSASTVALAFAAMPPAAAQEVQPPAMMGEVQADGMMAAATPADSHLLRVTIENLTTGQNFSPSFIVSTTRDATPLFDLGQTATDALVAVAEGGNIGTYSGDAAGLIGTTYGDAVIAIHTPPGGTRDVYVAVDEAHPLLSGVWMLGMTNDGFSGFSQVDAYALTAPMTFDVKGYDAGSEINSEKTGYLGALGGGNARDPENGVITIHTGIRGDADAPIAWNFDPNMVARVTITPVTVEDAMGGM